MPGRMSSGPALPTSPMNETHWGDPSYVKLYNQALATVDETKRTQIIHDMQKIDYEQGGYIIPFFTPLIDGYAANVHGLAAGKTGVPLNAYDFKQLWLS